MTSQRIRTLHLLSRHVELRYNFQQSLLAQVRRTLPQLKAFNTQLQYYQIQPRVTRTHVIARLQILITKTTQLQRVKPQFLLTRVRTCLVDIAKLLHQQLSSNCVRFIFAQQVCNVFCLSDTHVPHRHGTRNSMQEYRLSYLRGVETFKHHLDNITDRLIFLELCLVQSSGLSENARFVVGPSSRIRAFVKIKQLQIHSSL